MSDVDVKIGITVVDQAAKRALGDLGKATDDLSKKAENAGDKGSASVTKIGKAAKGAGKDADDAKGFFTKLADTIKEDLENSGSKTLGKLSGLISGPLIVAVGGAVAAVAGLKYWLDLTLHAERENQINNSFVAIAGSAGLAAGAIREQLVTAANGLADTEDILQAANRAIIQMGDNASVIPQTMEIARKATALYGGDLIANFEKINDAVSTGNTRLLKQIGLNIDAEAAQNTFAASIGTTRDKLNEAGQKQAILNAVLETAATKFKDVDENSTEATHAVKRFEVAVGDANDAVAAALSNSGFFAGALDVLKRAADGFRLSIGGGTETEKLIEQGNTVQDLKVKLERLNKEYENMSFLQNKDLMQRRIAETTAEFQKQKEVYLKMQEEMRKASLAPSGEFVKIGAQNEGNDKFIKSNDEDKQKEILADLDRARSAAEARQQILTAQREQDLINEQEYQTQRQEIAAQAFVAENESLQAQLNAKKISEQDYYESRDALALKFAADTSRREIENQKRTADLKKKELDAEEKLNDAKIKAASQFFGAVSSLMQTSSKEMFEIGKAAAIAQATINTYEAVTKTMANTPYPFNIPLAAAQGVAGAVQVANIAAQTPKFANGGIVPGSSYTGDKVQARVNSGEMILNDSQQAQLFKLANGQGGNDRTLALVSAVLAQPISIQIDGREIINVTRSQLAGGRSFS